MIRDSVLPASEHMIGSHTAQPRCTASLRLYVCAADAHDVVSCSHDCHRALLNTQMLMADSA